MASLIKQHGNYYLQFYNSNRTPTRKKVPLKVQTKRDAKKIERRLLNAYANGDFDPWTDDSQTFRSTDGEQLTITEALAQFLAAKEKQGCKERTIRNYRRSTHRLIKRIGDRKLDELTGDVLNEWIRDGEVSDTTQHTRYRYTHITCKSCCESTLTPAQDLH